ncbi:MAG: BMP family protein [Candidatus Hodarchaeota archaeon]
MVSKNATYAIVIIVVLGVAALGVWVFIQPVDNPYEVAIVFATGRLGDKSFNDGVFEGAERAHDQLGINFTYSEPDEIAQYETFLRQYASHQGYIQPYDLIISVGFDQADAVMAVADDHPDQKFAIIDMFIDPVTYPNVASLLFTENEGSALVGAIAGLTTQTNKIGFIGGMDIDLIRGFAAGFMFGVNWTNEAANVSIAYVGEWDNIPQGKALADGMYTTEDVDIIFAAAGKSGLGIFDSVKAITTNTTPIWCIGVDSPQMYLGCEDPENPAPPTRCLTSMLKRVDNAAFSIMQEAVLGTWVGGVQIFNLANDGHDYEVNEDLLTLPDHVREAADELKAMIINGTVTVPSNYTVPY